MKCSRCWILAIAIVPTVFGLIEWAQVTAETGSLLAWFDCAGYLSAMLGWSLAIWYCRRGDEWRRRALQALDILARGMADRFADFMLRGELPRPPRQDEDKPDPTRWRQ